MRDPKLIPSQNVCIIGSGVAGMATAVRLANKGYRVDVFEANTYPGGKLTAFEQEGFRFDAGPSLFTWPHLVDELFRLCGRDSADYFTYESLEVACRYFWEDGTHLKAYTNKERFAEEVEQVLGVPATRLHAYLKDVEMLHRYNTPLFLEKSLHKWQTYFSKEVLEALFQVHRFHLTRTMHDVNEKQLNEPHLVQLFDRMATYNGSSPYRAPGVLNIIAGLEHNHGTYLPVGGMHAITQALVKLAEDMGVTFHYQSRVESIEVSDKRVTGIRVNGEFVPAHMVVSNADVVPTYRHLLKSQPAPERTLRQERSSSALIFYWGIDREFSELDVHNIFFSADYEAEFRHLFDEREPYHDPTVYVNITSKRVSGDAPDGCENWFVMVNTPADQGQDWSEWIPQIREAVLVKLQRLLGVDLRPLIRTEAILDPPGIQSKTSSYQGALYGSSSNNRFAAFLRHPNFSQRLKGLYFCGGSVHPGGGVPICLLSAKIVDELVPEPRVQTREVAQA